MATRRTFLGGLMATAAAPLVGPHLVTAPQLLLPGGLVAPTIAAPEPAPPPTEPVLIAATHLPRQAVPLDVDVRRVEILHLHEPQPRLTWLGDFGPRYRITVSADGYTDDHATAKALLEGAPRGFRLRLHATWEPIG